MKRIIMHWTAGARGVNPHEADSYHFVINEDGSETIGVPVERNRPPLVNGAYAAHTLNCNSESIGVSMDAMAGAQERPFSAGSNPITISQLTGMINCVARLARAYGIPVTRQTVLSHAEVERTLGIKQRQKWDIMWLPGMDGPGDPIEVGDILRDLVKEAMGGPSGQPEPAPALQPDVQVRATLRQGAKGMQVVTMQNLLLAAGYRPLVVDGSFGPATLAALIWFQRRAGLTADGICGPQTWAALTKER